MQETNFQDERRTARRFIFHAQRQEHKELLLKQRRLCLSDVEQYLLDVTEDQFLALVSKLKQKSTLEILKRIKNAFKNLENIQAFYKIDGAFNLLISILIGNDSQKQLEAAACFINLACGPHKCCLKIAKSVGPYFISYINGSSHFLQDLSAWVVGNIAHDCIKCFSVLKAQGIIPALLKAVKSALPAVLQSTVFALNACTKYGDPDIVAIVEPEFLKDLLDLMVLKHVTETVLSDIAFTLLNCCYMAIMHNLKGVIDTDIVERILKCLNEAIDNIERNTLVITPLIRCLGYLSCQDDVSEYLNMHSTFRVCAAQLLRTGCYHWIKEVTWVLSNVTVFKGFNTDNAELVLPVNHLRNFLKAQNSDTLQILYYLLLMVSQNEAFHSSFKQQDLVQYVEDLSQCGEKNIENATKIFLSILLNNESVN